MDHEARKPIKLVGLRRAGTIALGVFFLALPVGAYFDDRLGWLGTADESLAAFSLVMAIFAVLGGVLIVSGIVGFWLMWKDVGPLNEAWQPDIDRVTATDPTPAGSLVDGASQPSENPPSTPPVTPPFPGEQQQVDLLEADAAFVEAAKSYYEDEMSTGTPFSKAVQSVWRSSHGRPNYFFEVLVQPNEVRWIRVPHRGRAGSGAGAASE